MLRGIAVIVAPAALAATLAACRQADAPATDESPAASHAQVVDLERRFAAAVRAQGTKAGFLAFLAEDSIVLQPGPVWGRAAWTSNDDLPGTLEWQPDLAQMSAGGDLGIATGPWQLTPSDPAGRRVEGRYVTVWQPRAEGWRVVFDGGYGRAPAGAWDARRADAELAPFGCEAGDAPPPGELQLLDLALSGQPAAAGAAERLLGRLADGALLFHSPEVTAAADAAARSAAAAALPAMQQYWPMGAGIAASGDLGYSYGLLADAPEASAGAAYLHVWCRQRGDWRLALQLRSAFPPPR